MRTGAAIVIIGHMNKVERSKGIYRGLGSIDITAAARSVLLIGKRQDDPNTRFMTQIKNNLSTFGKAVSFTINDSGGVKFLGECDISEEDLLSVTATKHSKFSIAKDLISTMLADGDEKSNIMFDACLKAGVTTSMMQYVKKHLGIISVRKIDDWYWTISPNAIDSNDDENTDSEQNSDIDETPLIFLDDFTKTEPTKQKGKKNKTTKPSPYGKLTLIDWTAGCAYE
jgi:hypothetical protein